MTLFRGPMEASAVIGNFNLIPLGDENSEVYGKTCCLQVLRQCYSLYYSFRWSICLWSFVSCPFSCQNYNPMRACTVSYSSFVSSIWKGAWHMVSPVAVQWVGEWMSGCREGPTVLDRLLICCLPLGNSILFLGLSFPTWTLPEWDDTWNPHLRL